MKDLLGFIILTSPLFLILLWLPVSILLSIWVSKRFIKKGLPLKITVGLIVFLIVLIIPIADEIAGRIYFNHLCETEAGVKVYQKIELPADCWEEDGRPIFYDGNTLPLDKYAKAGATSGGIEKLHMFGIQEFGTIFVKEDSGSPISTVSGFRYWGGWLIRNFAPHNTAISCGGGKSYNDLVNKQFIPKKNR